MEAIFDPSLERFAQIGKKAWQTPEIPCARNTGRLLLGNSFGWLHVHKKWNVLWELKLLKFHAIELVLYRNNGL